MSTLPARPRPRQLLNLRLLSLCLPLSFSLLLALGFWSRSAFARNATVLNNDHLHFSQQARLGFHSGDDWEPSITSDRFGHLYALYKHYDVNGGQTCPDCNLRMAFQRSSDEGRTWSQPRAIAPISFKGTSGQDDGHESDFENGCSSPLATTR